MDLGVDSLGNFGYSLEYREIYRFGQLKTTYFRFYTSHTSVLSRKRTLKTKQRKVSIRVG